jgi:hypothetical protein
MPDPSNTLLIEGSFTELSDELAQYLDVLRRSETSTLSAEIAPLLEPLRQQEQEGDEPDLKQRDEVLKKLVLAAAVLNAAPEKGRIGQSHNVSIISLIAYRTHRCLQPSHPPRPPVVRR